MYLPREVCLKHRKIRREISCGCESFTGLAAVFVFIGSKHIAAIVQEQDSWMPTRGCRCDSGWPYFIFQNRGVAKW